MQIDAARAKNIFKKADLDHDGIVTEKEIEKAEKDGTLTKDEDDLLRDTYNKQKKGELPAEDGYASMKFYEYLEGVNAAAKKQIFSQKTIDSENPTLTMGKIMSDPRAILKASPDILKDRKFILAAIDNEPETIRYLPDYQNDKEAMLLATKKDPGTIKYTGQTLKTRSFYLEAIKNNGDVFIDLPQYHGDKEFAMTAVKQKGEVLENVSRSLLAKNPDIIMEAVNNNGFALQYVPEGAKTKDVVMAAVKKAGTALQFAPKFKNDPEVVLAAIDKDGRAIEHADDHFKKDRDTAIRAVRSNGYALSYIDQSFRGEKEIALIAVKQYGQSIAYAYNDKIDLRTDRDVVMAAVHQYGFAISDAPKFKSDKGVILEALKTFSGAVSYADSSLKKDESFMLQAVKIDPGAFACADQGLRASERFQLAVVKASFNVYEEINNSYKGISKDGNAPISGKLSPAVTDAYESIKKQCVELGIDKSDRFCSTDVAKELIKNRREIGSHSSKPVALVVYPKEDYNGAFKNNEISELINKGYKVLYFESNEDKDLVNAIRTAGATDKLSLLVIGGHGSKTATQFGNFDPELPLSETEEYLLDTSDADKLKGLNDYMKPNSTIILESCGTGEGGAGTKNVANLLRNEFKNSQIFAPMVPTAVLNYNYDKNNAVTGVNYKCGEEKTYSMQPQYK